MLKKHHKIRAFLVGDVVHDVILAGKIINVNPATSGPGVIERNNGDKFILKQRSIRELRVFVTLRDRHVDPVIKQVLIIILRSGFQFNPNIYLGIYLLKRPQKA